MDVLFFLFFLLVFFKAKSPTFVGLFMDKKSMLRNGVENFEGRNSRLTQRENLLHKFYVAAARL